MKSLLLFILIFPIAIWAQIPEMSVKTQSDINRIKEKTPFLLKGDKNLMEYLPVSEINGELYVSFVGKLNAFVTDIIPVDNVIIGKGDGKIKSVRVKVTNLDAIEQLSQFEQLEIAAKIRPLIEGAAFDTRADSVHQGLNLPQPYTGKGVLIGVNDWGFDYTSPMFYDTLLENSRILAAWDQWKRSGPHPDNYDYGTEYNSWADLSAAQSDTSNQYGYGTHGTHVAGIAAGNGAGLASGAKGMAYEAEYLFTTIWVDEAAAIDSWYWMYEKSIEYGKNLVVNMSWGLYNIGTSDGTSLLSQAMDELTDWGVLFITSAGNNGNVSFHIKKEFNQDSIITIVNFENYNQHDSLWGQSIHSWGEAGKDFEMQIQVYRDDFLAETPYYSASFNGFDEGYIPLPNNIDTVWYNIAAEEAHPQNQKPTIRFRVKNKNIHYRIHLKARAEEGTVHFWNVAELTTNGGNWGLPFASFGPEYTFGDKEYGIGEPASGNSCLAIASHIPEKIGITGNITGGNRSSFSSRGPRIDGALKPNISAPGQAILSSINSFSDEPIVNPFEFNGKTYGYASFSGTSMSSPATAGVAALIWEANPYLSPYQIMDILIETARTDNHTGAIPEEGDVEWGHGKVNAIKAIQLAIGIVGIQEYENNLTEWEIYPNPSSNIISLKGLENIEAVEIYDLTGKVTYLDSNQNSWEISSLSAGTYLFRAIANQRVYQKKFIKL